MMSLLFHYGDPFVDVSSGRRETLPRVTITGQRIRPINVRVLGKTGILLVTFHPWGASAFLPGSMMELADRLVDRMQEALSALERVALVESFLLREVDVSRRDEVAPSIPLFGCEIPAADACACFRPPPQERAAARARLPISDVEMEGFFDELDEKLPAAWREATSRR
jgi:hypothetical protein